MAAVIFTVDATTGLGQPGLSSEEIASAAAEHNDVLIPFGSVDPHAADAVPRARRLVTEYGVRGFSSIPACRRSSRTTGRSTRCTGRSKSSA